MDTKIEAEPELESSQACQEALQRIWADVLGLASHNPTANFFDLGGDSMKVMDVIVRVRDEIGVDLPLMVFFEDPTLAHVASFVQQSMFPASSSIEITVVSILAEVLQVPTLDPRTNFFDAGGNSMLALDVILRVRQSLDVELPLLVFFEEPTAEHIISYIRELKTQCPSTQQTIEKIWGEILGNAPATPSLNFFDAGGNSMSAMDMILRIQEEFAVELPLLVFFEQPTVAHVAAFIDGSRTAAISTSITRSLERSQFPLAHSQEPFWLLEQRSPGVYNTARIFSLEGTIEPLLLNAALNEICRRHEILRVRFVTAHDGPVQIVQTATELAMEVIDVSALEPRQREAESRRITLATVREPLHLREGEVLRARLLRLAHDKWLLCIAIHHAVSDGVSGGVLLDELVSLYDSLTLGQTPALPEPELHFTDYAVWERTWMQGARLDEELAYWMSVLRDAPHTLKWPNSGAQKNGIGQRGATHLSQIPSDLRVRLKAFAQTNGTTLFTTLATALRTLLYRWSGQSDFVLGTIASNRSRSGTERMIGCFVNPLPLRNSIQAEQSLSELLRRENTANREAFAHQDCPFTKIVEAANPDRTAGDNPLFNVALLLQNFPVIRRRGVHFKAEHTSIDAELALLDLRFIVSETDEAIEISCQYNVDLFEESTIVALADSYLGVLDQLMTAPEQSVDNVTLTEGLQQPPENPSAEANQYNIVIAANFTAEPIETPLNLWLKQLQLPARVQFAPFDQVFQQLLDPGSLLSRNRNGISALLVQWRENTPPGNQARELAAALKASPARQAAPLLLFLCPPWVDVEDETLASELVGQAGIYVIRATEILDLYPVEEIFDEYAAELGAIPYSNQFYLALASFVARRIYALKSNPFKAIALDCDNTLWQGVCGEDGPLGVHIGRSHRALHEFMLAQRDAGMLLCLCSKNTEADVAAVFENNPDMLLRREHFAAARVNWDSKSENLIALSAQLNIGLDSFVFLDDNPLECAEVRARCPEVLALELPPNPQEIPHFLKHIWAFDRYVSTAEDRRRSELYRQEQEREQARSQTATLEDFLLGLELAVRIDPMTALELPRAAQLTLRTNQFNCSTVRRTEEEIASFCHNDGESLVVHVKDRFGDYGLVGLILFTISAEALKVDTFLLSCRALGRRVEHQMLIHLAEIAQSRKLSRVDIAFAQSEKNKPASLFLEAVAAGYSETEAALRMYRLPAEQARRAAEFAVIQPEPEQSSASRSFAANLIRPDLHYMATRLNTVQAVSDTLLSRPASQQPHLVGERTSTVTEEVLAAIWTAVLHGPRPAIHDNFFQIGGNSLLGVQMISRVRQAFDVDLPIRALFEDPALNALACRIDAIRAAHRDTALPPLVRRNSAGGAASSFAQQRLWFINQLDQAADAVYNISQMISIRGQLNTEALEASLREIIRRHEILRTTFQDVDGEPTQIIGSVPESILAIIDFTHLSGESLETEIANFAAVQAAQPFDLKHAVLRITLLRAGVDRHVLLIVLHHIAGDRWSAGILAEEVAALYAAYVQNKPSPLEELPVQYSDYAIWQRAWLVGEILNQQLAYWKEQLQGAPALLDLPTDKPRPPVLRHKGATISRLLPADLIRTLTMVSNGEGATLFMTLLAALQTLLGFYSGQEEVVVGSPIAGRNRVEIEKLIGFFVNTLALRGDLSGNPTFREFLSRVRRTALDAYANQDLPFEKLVEELQPERSLSYQPIFQVLFALQNAPQTTLQLSGLTLERLPLHQGTTAFDMSWFATEVEDAILLRIEYDTDLFSLESVQAMAEHFETLLERVAISTNTRLSDLMLVSDSEQLRIAHGFNNTIAEYPRDICIQDLVHQRAARCPQAVAIVDGITSIRYEELEARANQIANYLIALGAGPDVPVAIFMKRSASLVESILGILKAGSAYVPLDPAYPADRLRYILEDAQAPILIAESCLEQDLPPFAGKVLFLDRAKEALDTESTAPPQHGATPSNLAYILFTSGSTGRPKGVAIEHRTPVTFIQWALEVYSDEELSGVLFATSICFDVSMFEMFVTLSAGGTVIVAENALSLPELSARNKVTLINAVPSVMAELVRAGGVPRSVLTVNLAGEAVPNVLADRIYQLTSAQKVYNLYGPTETSYATFTLLARGRSVTIGKPLANTFCYVLDPQLRLMPVGMPGELCIAGDGVARGYYRHPELTTQRFLTNPHGAGSGLGTRIYKTGDRCRWLANGELQYLGRSDFQVKLRGFRIELGEIESVLDTYPGVQGSVALVREDDPGVRRLVAYVVPTLDQQPSPENIRQYVRTRLPDFMVPSDLVVLDEFPRTANGKINRQKLPAPAREKQHAYVAPETAAERKLAEIWSMVLQVQRIGADDNFFELGGHSLLAMQLISRIRRALNVDLPVRSVFEAPTIRGLAACASNAGQSGPFTSIPRATRDGRLPLSSAQERLWFLDQLEPANSQYNFPMSMRLNGPVDASSLEAAINALVVRHEVLRTAYRQTEDGPIQFILPEAKIELAKKDVSHLSEDAREREARQLVIVEGQRPFDLSTGPLIRAYLIRLHRHDHILLLNMHHSVTDAWSMRPLVHELGALYEAARTQQPCLLPELPLQYADYAVWQRSWMASGALGRELDYWKEHLAGAPSRIALPTDYPRPAIQSYSGATETVHYPKDLLDKLHALALGEDATLYMVLMTAFAALLHHYSGQESVVIGTIVANRSRAELEELIGLFVNTLPIHVRLDSNPSFRELLGQLRAATLGAFTNSEVPFEELVKAIAPERDLSANPIAQAFLILQDPRRPALRVADLEFTGITIHNERSKFDIGLFMVERPQGLECTAEFATDLFDRSTIRRMLEQLGNLLRAAVEDPAAQVSSLPLLSTSEEDKILFEWNATVAAYPNELCIHQLFETQVRRVPNRTAASSGDYGVTYSELNRMANRVAHGLRAQGVGPRSLVAVLMSRSIEMLASLIGILKSGAAYVPLDPSFPKERVAFILDDSHVQTLITDDTWSDYLQYPTDNLPCPVESDALAYVLHTSGSTGKPKGVEITHKNVVNFLCSMQTEPGLTQNDKLLAVTTISFDIAGLELYLPLITGATVQIASREEATDGNLLLTAMRKHQPTVLQATPAAWRMLIDSGWEGCPSLKVLCGGEALPAELAAQLLPRCLELWNMYGPTETTIWSSVHKLDSPPAGTASLGRPIANTTMYILDSRLRPVPIGVAGELYIGGDGVGKGYLNRPELTAERFLHNPFVAGSRMYRTGDLARFDRTGSIFYLGRTDLQVKVRGFRIELGEIETVLGQHTSIRECVVTAGDRGINGYVIPASGHTILADDLRRWCREKLPEYMVPGSFTVMERFTLTPNGKVDRKALPAPESFVANFGKEHTNPQGPIQEMIIGFWVDVLKRNVVSPDDNFFQLGGHSLSATQIVGRVRAALEVNLPVRAFFEAPTPRGLARIAEGLVRSKDKVPVPEIRPAVRSTALPLSLAQQRLWFIQQMEPHSPLYNVPWALRLKGPVNVDIVRQALNGVVQRHEILRTVYHLDQDRDFAAQVVQASTSVPFRVEDLSSLSPERAEQQVRRLVQQEAAKPFDLASDIMLRALLLKLGEQDCVLMFNTHHIACDAWSLGILASEFSSFYQAVATASDPQLPKLSVQYADYAVWQRNWFKDDALEQHVTYWKTRLVGAPPFLALPTDRERTEQVSWRGAAHRTLVPEQLHQQLVRLSRQHGVTLFMTMLSAFECLVSYLTKQTDIVLGTDLAGRTAVETEALIGFFVNLVAIRADLSGDPTFRELTWQVRELTLGAHAHQDLPFDRIVEEVQPERRSNRHPLVQVLFVHQNTPTTDLKIPDVDVTGFPIEVPSKFDLAVFYTQAEAKVTGIWVYNPDLFEPKTIARMTKLYNDVLALIANDQEIRLSDIAQQLGGKDGEARSAEHARFEQDNRNKLSLLKRKSL